MKRKSIAWVLFVQKNSFFAFVVTFYESLGFEWRGSVEKKQADELSGYEIAASKLERVCSVGSA